VARLMSIGSDFLLTVTIIGLVRPRFLKLSDNLNGEIGHLSFE